MTGKHNSEVTFQVKAEDIMGHDLLTLKVYILRNPCVNEGVCEGPETDPECTSTNRSTGGYNNCTLFITYMFINQTICDNLL